MEIQLFSSLRDGCINLSDKCPKPLAITLLVAGILTAFVGGFGLAGNYHLIKELSLLSKEVSIALTSTGGAITVLFAAILYFKPSPITYLGPIAVTGADFVRLKGKIERSECAASELTTIVQDAFDRNEDVMSLKLSIAESDDGNLVFSHIQTAGLVYKVGIDKDREERMAAMYSNMAVARKVCEEHNLDLLKVPSCVLEHVTIQGITYPVLIMEHHPINYDPAVQKMFYLSQTSKLEKTIRQLDHFITITGWSYVTWKKMPILEESFKNPQFSALLLVNEHMSSPEEGLNGCQLRRRREELDIYDGGATSIQINVCGLLACIPASYRHLVEHSSKPVKKEPSLDAPYTFFSNRGIWRGNELVKFENPPSNYTAKQRQLEEKLCRLCNEQIADKDDRLIELKDRRLIEILDTDLKNPKVFGAVIDPEDFVRVTNSLKERGYIWGFHLSGDTFKFLA